MQLEAPWSRSSAKPDSRACFAVRTFVATLRVRDHGQPSTNRRQQTKCTTQHGTKTEAGKARVRCRGGLRWKLIAPARLSPRMRMSRKTRKSKPTALWRKPLRHREKELRISILAPKNEANREIRILFSHGGNTVGTRMNSEKESHELIGPRQSTSTADTHSNTPRGAFPAQNCWTGKGLPIMDGKAGKMAESIDRRGRVNAAVSAQLLAHLEITHDSDSRGGSWPGGTGLSLSAHPAAARADASWDRGA